MNFDLHDFFQGRSERGKNTFTEKMKRKIDSTIGRYFYSKWLSASVDFCRIYTDLGYSTN